MTTIGREESPLEDMAKTSFQDVQSDSKVAGLAEPVAAASLVLAVEHVAAEQEAPGTVVSAVFMVF